MTTEPDGVYTAQPVKEVDARTSSAISVLMGRFVLMATVKFIWVWGVPLRGAINQFVLCRNRWSNTAHHRCQIYD